MPEDQLATLMTNAAAAGELPDVVLGTPLDQSQQYAPEEIFDSEAAQAVVDKLGAGHLLQEGARPRQRATARRPASRATAGASC